MVSFHSRHKESFALFFLNGGSRINVASIDDDFENTDIVEDNDDIVLLSATSCFMRRNLTRITGYFEQTIPRYLVDEFKQHFRMTKETLEILSREIIRRGRIPLGNPSGRPVIQPQKQILTFL